MKSVSQLAKSPRPRSPEALVQIDLNKILKENESLKKKIRSQAKEHQQLKSIIEESTAITDELEASLLKHQEELNIKEKEIEELKQSLRQHQKLIRLRDTQIQTLINERKSLRERERNNSKA